ncbi:bifunctional DedA family/phosphatase PAP2 family protein [Gynuella sunshinyii]|uniref:Putative membrane-associated protein n=1 Tax=Gynuella sunshinyii YC6258 TaxID=1445510 RepID=A0A0C5VVG8_9GAMM|nr:bifunctional DedA family/phosphatase PAP2 family protein [Gynuella sunshinyii]AJQ94459.1 putative membrane-associated protein [Gynuella sunshinyii YC6258]
MDFVTAWIRTNPEFALYAIFTITFIESFAFIGALVPGVVVLFAASALIASMGISGLLPLILVAGAASSLANILSFYLGYLLRDRLHHWPVAQRYGSILSLAERFIDKWGTYSVIAGRFIGPIRPFVAFIAGTLSMPPRRFVTLDLITVLAWAPIYIVPGYMAGLTADYLLSDWHRWPPAVILSFIAATSIALFSLGNYWIQHHQQKVNHWRHKLGVDELPFASLLLLILSSMGLVWLCLNIPLKLDLPFMLGLKQMYAPWTLTPTLFITHMGDFFIVFILGVMWTGGLAIYHSRRAGIIILLALIIAPITVFLLKELFHVARPTTALVHMSDFAFPSGHATAATIYWGLTAAFLNENIRFQRRWIIYAAAIAMIFLIAYSRLWLRVHWVSDVMAGVLLGSMVVTLVRVAYAFFRLTPLRINRFMQLFLYWQLVTLTCYAYSQT